MELYTTKITVPINSNDLKNLNVSKGTVLSESNIEELNTSYYKKSADAGGAAGTQPDMPPSGSAARQNSQPQRGTFCGAAQGSTSSAGVADMVPVRVVTLPNFTKKASKGQKLPLNFAGNELTVNFGWNVKNTACDVDVSAFMLSDTGRVVGDDYFVFYGQDTSPEGSIIFKNIEDASAIESFSIDFAKLSAAVKKIVFVMTINEALEKSLNFSMLKDAYIQLVDTKTNTEIASFLAEEYYDSITSMMMGEIYLHNGAWKFNAVGNGVNRDLAGLCELYGVQVV